MPLLSRPDGVEIHWEERGEGSPVLVALHAFALPEVYSDLVGQLARDNRLVTYDPRGSGRSTRVAPADLTEDVGDLEAVLEQIGNPAVVVAFGDSGGRAAILAERRPDLVRSVVVAGASPVPPSALTEGEGPVSSRPAVETLFELAELNPRAGLRGLLELTNPGTSHEELRARVDGSLAYHVPEGIVARLHWYFEGSSIESMRALGDRFWIAFWESAWSPPEVMRELPVLLPRARIERVAEGAIARPELTAELVRRAVAES